jgi:DNA-binding XRE family transcriptional regulator
MSSKPHNYVRTYRRRSSLGQQDLAFLKVCRYEQGHRLPSLRTALELAVILDVSIAALFGGLQHEVQKRIAERIAALRSELDHKRGAGRVSTSASRQLRWLNDHHGLTQSNEHQTI